MLFIALLLTHEKAISLIGLLTLSFRAIALLCLLPLPVVWGGVHPPLVGLDLSGLPGSNTPAHSARTGMRDPLPLYETCTVPSGLTVGLWCCRVGTPPAERRH